MVLDHLHSEVGMSQSGGFSKYFRELKFVSCLSHFLLNIGIFNRH